jgi:antibiotic biosynthesis monooxygenase (ABM) superfamily enzyme
MNELTQFITTDSTPIVVQLACIILAAFSGYKYTQVTRQSSYGYFVFVVMFSYATCTLVKAWFSLVVN